ncbi:MAG: hypothetical protein KAV87_59165, partial [Desulfobacteraceae bacterium]|nr:hypothetical protein [Desulfobacteraceae bacterium]
ARIKTGLSIISTLSDYFGVTMPAIIDNAEAVTQFPPLPMQTIKLVVSEKEKEITVSKDN